MDSIEKDRNGNSQLVCAVNPCLCGSHDISSVTQIRKGWSKLIVYCRECSRETRPHKKLIDAVNKWNEMNESEGSR